MSQTESEVVPYPGLFKDLLNRRVPQLVGFYLAGSWGILQFFDWIVGRYLLSPLLVDMALTIIGALLPSILILAYCHGSPGKDKWQRIEKIAIPVNLVLTFVLVFSLFSHKNLDSIARRVAVTDETGKKIEKVVPKTGLVKELAVFDLKNLSGDKGSDWLKNGLIDLLTIDLSQDPFVNVKSSSTRDILDGFYIYRKFKNAGFDNVSKAPLMLKKKIANEINSFCFLSGTINKIENIFEVKVKIYLTKDSKIISDIVLKEKDIFTLIDKLTVFVKKSLKLPSYKNDEIIDLQIKDIYTESEKAAKLLALASKEMMKNNNWKGAQKHFEDAIKEDKTFALAYAGLSQLYFFNNKSNKGIATYKILMKYLYKLPEKSQLIIKVGYYITVKGQPEKAVSLLKMLIKLYPADLVGYINLATRLDITGEYVEAIKYYKKILDMEPAKFSLYNKIGNAYLNKSDHKNALHFFKKYSDRFPKKPAGFLKVGGVYENIGDFVNASKYYEKALLLEPEKISTVLLIASLDMKNGKFKKAYDKYVELLNSIEKPRDKVAIFSTLSDYYDLKGVPAKQLEYTELLIKEFEKFSPPLQVMITRIVTTNVYIKNGKHKEAKALLDSLSKTLKPPFDKFISLGYFSYYMELKEFDEAEKHIKNVVDMIKKIGTKQFLFFVNKSRGDISRLKGEYKTAIELYKKALKLRNKSISILNNLAKCYLSEKNFDLSLDYINKALKISPFDPQSNYNFADLCFATGKDKLGLKHLRKALLVWDEADPDYRPVKKARELLNKYEIGESNGK